MPFIVGKTICETFLERARATPKAVGYQYKELNQWHEVTYGAFHDRVREVSFGLMQLGVKRGDKIAILANTRFEWSVCDMAILGAGAITVPIYASSTASDVSYILNHSEASLVIAEDLHQLEKLLDAKARAGAAGPRQIILIDPTAASAEQAAHFEPLSALTERGRAAESRHPERFERNLREASPDDLFMICYTSGTTGTPKGVMLTHDNLMSVLEDCLAILSRVSEPERETVLSFLPFSHVLGNVESKAGHVFGWRQAFAENLDKLVTNIGEVNPTLLFAVPRIFEKGYNRIQGMLDESWFVKRKLFDWALKAGHRYYGALWQKRVPAVRDFAEYMTARQLVFSKVSDRFGGKLRYAVSGGAPLSKEIGEFFQIVGIKVLEGYGLTETCAPIAVNTPEAPRFGTVGRPLPEVTIKIGDDGEILVKSRKVFKGYYKNEAETAAVIQDGWFHTGDIGFLDDEGYLHITDRKKDLIVTSAGKNIAPQKIEGLARAYPLISQFVVQGERRHFLTALITLDREQLIRYATENRILFSEYRELVRNPKILALVQKLIDDLNRQLASYETIKKFLILPTEFTVESGELTPSLKVRRNLISERYRAELDQLYSP